MSYTTRTTLQRTAAGLLLLSTIPAASADCFFDNRGREICNGLPNAARIGIGLGVFALVALIVLAIGIRRRRRIQRVNQSYITNANSQQAYTAPGNYNSGNTYNNNAQGYDPTNAGQAPQYPPQTHTGPPYGQYPEQGGYNTQPYAHPTPPQYSSYAPPPGPPPADKV